MASISVKTFVNGSLVRTIAGKNMGRFEVVVGRHRYVLVTWGSAQIDKAFKERARNGEFICFIPNKMALALLHAVRSEGFLDLNPKDFT